jgi:hypothetical protein
VAKDRVSLGTVIKLALACLVVGLILAALNVTPADLWARVSGMVMGLWRAAQGLLGWAGSYMLLGALVVLPIWLVLYLWRRMNRGGD